MAANKIAWAPKVAKEKIYRLYTSDARGFLDEELIDEVGWALWSRCDSILTVTKAHYGSVLCPGCGSRIERTNAWAENELIRCPDCGWEILWSDYHRSYRGKQLFGANAVDIFESYHHAFPHAKPANQKMFMIDRLIHGFHHGLSEIGRPVGANLIEGSLKEVIQFLDGLSSGDTQIEWKQTIASVEWAREFLKPNENASPGKDRMDGEQ